MHVLLDTAGDVVRYERDRVELPPEGHKCLPVERQYPPLGPHQRYPDSPTSRGVIGGVWVEVFAAQDIPLEEIRAAAVERVNRQAGEQRAAHITVTVGQEATYLAKAAEAARWLADPDPEPARYPYLAAEAAATGTAISEVATLIDVTATAWTTLNAQIEARRRGALAAMATATSPEQVDTVFPVSWPELR